VDFFKISTRSRNGRVDVYPDFLTNRTKDLMVQGTKFYAFWDADKGLWSTDSYRLTEQVDMEIRKHVGETSGSTPLYMGILDSGVLKKFRELCKVVDDNYKPLNQNVVWANTDPKREDYASFRLPYTLEPGEHLAWDELMNKLYSPTEKAKLEWAIGALVSGDSKKLQKCIVIYGQGGKGKSTVLNIIQEMFHGYWTAFRAADMANANKDFSMASFESFPLIAIDHDTDLSRISDNSKLNSVIAHEDIVINQKYKTAYQARIQAMLFMATNSPVSITDQNSGLIRRMIDVEPTGDTFSPSHYEALMKRIRFEHGAIAYHCLDVFKTMGANHYRDYVPTKMMLKTNVFYNFVEANYDVFKSQDFTWLDQAWKMYKEYCEENNNSRALPRHKFREELKTYFEEFNERKSLDGKVYRNWFGGFKMPGQFKEIVEDDGYKLVLEETISPFDDKYSDYPAQYATEDDVPKYAWSRVKTTLSDIDTRKVHFVKVPEQHIVIDFDLRGPRGGKDLERNLEEASMWPPTYAEISKSGGGVHLHYIYEGDVSILDSNFTEGIEVKVYKGGASLRRKLTRCNALPVNVLSSGLLTKEKKVLNTNTIKSEKGLRDLIGRNLRKEIHPGTKPSIDFIKKILDEAYSSEMVYDLTDMRASVLAFANNSTNKALECIKIVQSMKFSSENSPGESSGEVKPKDDRIVIYDVEVYPNLFVVCWKFEDSPTVARMVNPGPDEVEELFKFKLVGFNNRRYDNHILYARYLGYDNQKLFELSQKIIANNRQAMFGEAYNLSYADIWDFASIKQSLKKWEIDLGIHHMEMDLPWDQPVPDDMVDKVVEYCVNDVMATEAVLKDRAQDFVARKILAELSGLSINSSTQQHTAKIIFEGDKDASKGFEYTDLSKQFPGYEYDMGVSTYRGETVGEGGYVYAEPGIYDNVILLDVASMHPTSIEQLNLFGEYTENFAALKEARLAIKHKDYDAAKVMLGGKLGPYLNNPEEAEALSYALKIVINIVYGLTSAKFDNPFRDNRNVDNIVAKRGALFMIDLKHYVQEKGYQVAHIKTDSIKIPNGDAAIAALVMDFGEKYGYTFEWEATYDKFCLVNDAVYVAKDGDKWTAVGAQFQHPYVFKQLFSHEAITLDDYCEARSVVQGAMYLDFDWDRAAGLDHDMMFVGRTGRFIPVLDNGAKLLRIKDDKQYAVTGTKGYLWVEAEQYKQTPDKYWIDTTYFEKLVDDAISTISKFGDFDRLVEG